MSSSAVWDPRYGRQHHADLGDYVSHASQPYCLLLGFERVCSHHCAGRPQPNNQRLGILE